MKRIVLNLVGALAVGSALHLQLPTAFAQGETFKLLTTFTNPTPAANDWFGISMAAVGTDRMLVGAPGDDTGAKDAGAAYLFKVNGALLTTFTNPTPADSDHFGISVVAVGTARVLIGADLDDTGAEDAGAAYLFNTSGALLTTFTNPAPESGDGFGCSVAAVGTDRVLIGAWMDDKGAWDAGAAYLFGTTGTLLTAFTNPTPATDDRFGWSVAAVGTDVVLIGAYLDDTGAENAGAAYLFSTNGALLTAFTSPAPATDDEFGISAAAVGSDRVLIGAVHDDTGGEDAGAAYLFSTNGALLTTFTSPTPIAFDWFGRSVAGVGKDRVLIGSPYGSTGAYAVGGAYLFSTDGTLLTAFTNPTPATTTMFGFSTAAVGNDRVLIGTVFDNVGTEAAGAAYLFSLTPSTPEAPSLTIRLSPTNTLAVSWPSASTGWTLQQDTNGVTSGNWSDAPGAIQDDGTTKTLLIAPPTENRFYRLFKP